MGQKFNGCAALLLALGLGIEPLEARDRKSAAKRNAESPSETTSASATRSVALRPDSFSASTASFASSSAVIDRPSGQRNRKPASPLAEQPPSTSNPLRLNFGAVTLQPAVGGVKGAQFSIGF